MIVLFKKNNDVGEIRIIVTEIDRAERLVNGVTWVSLNHAINEFNKDPKIKNINLTAAFAGNVPHDVLNAYCNMWANNSENQLTVKDDKQKVFNNGENEKEEQESNQNKPFDEALKDFLSNADMKCKVCLDEDKALVDKEGNLYPCKSCIEIDAYLKGKKEGYDKGFDEGYKACMKNFQTICDNIESDKKESEK